MRSNRASTLRVGPCGAPIKRLLGVAASDGCGELDLRGCASPPPRSLFLFRGEKGNDCVLLADRLDRADTQVNGKARVKQSGGPIRTNHSEAELVVPLFCADGHQQRGDRP